MEEMQPAIRGALSDKRVNRIHDFLVVTDRLDYAAIDQVFPLFAEQQFFLDELVPEKIGGAEALEIGLGSGVLSIGAVRAGARHVTALEINPRARSFAGFNLVLNRVEDRVTISEGHADIYRPVNGRRFDYILSNPPFEPTPPGMRYFHHSAAGPYGLDFIDALFAGLDDHLGDGGHAQIVTAAPGDAHAPTLLLDLARRRLAGRTRVVLNPFTMTFDTVMDRLADKRMGPAEEVAALRRRARDEGVTHLHLCVIHYERGATELRVEHAARSYDHYWDIPAVEVTV